MHPELLNSWKDIANYLGRGVRTVQRWEAQLHLPVRRAHMHPRSSVTALKSDIDQWVRKAGRSASGARVSLAEVRDTTATLRIKREEMRILAMRVCDQMEHTQELIKRACELARKNEVTARSVDHNRQPIEPPRMILPQ